MRKRLLSIFLCCALLICFGMTSIAAADDSVAVGELYAEFATPNGWSTLTRETPEDDPMFTSLGTDKTSMLKFFENGGIYYNAIDMSTCSKEIVVTKLDNEEVYDWNGLTDEELQSVAENYLNGEVTEGKEMAGLTFKDYQLVGHPQVKWIKLAGTYAENNTVSDLMQYVTVVNGQQIGITLRSYNGPISDGDEEILDDFVQSTHFTEITQKPFRILDFIKSNFLILVIATGVFVLLLASLVAWLCVRGAKKKKAELLDGGNQPVPPAGSGQGGSLPFLDSIPDPVLIKEPIPSPEAVAANLTSDEFER